MTKPEVAIMIEGQMGLNWPRWKRMVRAVEDLGFVGLYRSDHFVNPNPPDEDSLELWVSLTWLADHTERITFGPLVTPVSFRHPAMTARMASAVDDLSGGRLTLGVGAGWQDREHHNYSYDLLKGSGARFDRLEEALHVLTRLLQSDAPVTFEGDYYQFYDAVLLPRPARPGGPPILIGGNGPERTLPMAARFASEWNAVFVTPPRFAELNALMDDLLAAEGRAPESMRRSLMAGLVFGRTDGEVRQKLRDAGAERDDLAGRGMVVGTPSEVVDHLERLGEAGVQRVMLQWLALDDLDGLEALAQAVL
jgi:F420-dependent oxidoreductase-like protein